MAVFNNMPDMMEDYISPASIETQERMELESSMESGRSVKVTPVKEVDFGDGDAWVICQYGKSRIEIWIPAVDWFIDMPDHPVPLTEWDQAPVSPSRWATYNITAQMGGKFKVIITGIDAEGDKVRFQASRVLSMNRDKKRIFFPLTAEGVIDEDRQPKVGDIIYCRVVSALRRSVKVEVAGVEVQIRRDEMDWIYPVDCREKYLPGDVLKAVILDLSIVPDETGTNGDVSIALSVKQVTPQNNAGSKYSKGDRVFGHVISQLPEGLICELCGEVTCFVSFSPKFTRPRVGDAIIVEIVENSEREDGSYWLNGIIKTRCAYRDRD